MNIKVLKTSIILVLVILFAQYVLKILFPQEFILVINNPNIIAFGEWVDKYIIIREIFSLITSIITYYLFLCSVTKQWYLKLKQFLKMLVIVVMIQLITFFEPNFAMAFAIIGMIGLACYFKAEFKSTVIVFSVHTIAQILSYKIRDLMLVLLNTNYITIFCVGIECWLWLILFYFIGNYKIKEIKNG